MQDAHPTYSLLEDKLLLVNLIEQLLNSILEETSRIPPIDSSFNCKSPPRILIGEYLKRKPLVKTSGLAKYSHCSNSAYVMALILIDKF
jgi:hypothetical protein